MAPKNPSFRCRLHNDKWVRITVSKDTIQFEEWINEGWSHLPNITSDEPVAAPTFAQLQTLVLEACDLLDEEMDPDEWDWLDQVEPHEDDVEARLEYEAQRREDVQNEGDPA